MNHHEENEQIAFMNYCKLLVWSEYTIFDLMIHIRNESHEKGSKEQIIRRIARAKKAGYKSGTPDLFLSLPIHGKPGLFIEMKRKRIKANKKMGIKGGRGVISKKQYERLKIHEACGYCVKVCEGWEEARIVLDAYLKGEL